MLHAMHGVHDPQVPSSSSALLVLDLFASSAGAVAWLFSVLAEENQSEMKHQALGAAENSQSPSLAQFECVFCLLRANSHV